MDAKEAIEELESTLYSDYVTSNAAIYAAIEALEKQIPKKPKHIETDGFGYCPNCGECAETIGYDAIQFNFCDKCGQRLDWGDNHDTEA